MKKHVLPLGLLALLGIVALILWKETIYASLQLHPYLWYGIAVVVAITIIAVLFWDQIVGFFRLLPPFLWGCILFVLIVGIGFWWAYIPLIYITHVITVILLMLFLFKDPGSTDAEDEQMYLIVGGVVVILLTTILQAFTTDPGYPSITGFGSLIIMMLLMGIGPDRWKGLVIPARLLATASVLYLLTTILDIPQYSRGWIAIGVSVLLAFIPLSFFREKWQWVVGVILGAIGVYLLILSVPLSLWSNLGWWVWFIIGLALLIAAIIWIWNTSWHAIAKIVATLGVIVLWSLVFVGKLMIIIYASVNNGGIYWCICFLCYLLVVSWFIRELGLYEWRKIAAWILACLLFYLFAGMPFNILEKGFDTSSWKQWSFWEVKKQVDTRDIKFLDSLNTDPRR